MSEGLSNKPCIVHLKWFGGPLVFAFTGEALTFHGQRSEKVFKNVIAENLSLQFSKKLTPTVTLARIYTSIRVIARTYHVICQAWIGIFTIFWLDIQNSDMV